MSGGATKDDTAFLTALIARLLSAEFNSVDIVKRELEGVESLNSLDVILGR